jgi:hypothetical protein
MKSLFVALVLSTGIASAAEPPATIIKTESFDRDPRWEGHNNRVEPKRVPTITQDFGYSATSHAAKVKGEVGGQITRSTKPASYGLKVSKTLNDTLSASGTFALTKTTPGGGYFFGWFAAEQEGGGGRPVGSLGFNFDGEHTGGRLACRLITAANKSCGTFITPFVPGKYRPTPIKNDGTRYHWSLNYDPAANDGKGRFLVVVTSDAKTDDWESKTFTIDLPDGYKKDGAAFDRFGFMNMMKTGGSITAYFGDLDLDGQPVDLSKDPGWVGSNNRETHPERDVVGAHDFGFSNTTFAGGTAGEIGGNLWRSGKYAYYADRVGPLSLDDRLEASGHVILKVGAPDSDMFIGWFGAAQKDKPPTEAGHFLGVHVGGPTRVGHYFNPALTTGKGTRGKVDKGPVIVPGRVYEWSLVYDPSANGGNGEIRVTLGKEAVTLALKPGWKAQGATLDRFGLFTSDIGGQLVRIYFDDLKYSSARK